MSDDGKRAVLIALHRADVRKMQRHGQNFIAAVQRIVRRGATTHRLFDGSDYDGLPTEAVATTVVDQVTRLPWDTSGIGGRA